MGTEKSKTQQYQGAAEDFWSTSPKEVPRIAEEYVGLRPKYVFTSTKLPRGELLGGFGDEKSGNIIVFIGNYRYYINFTSDEVIVSKELFSSEKYNWVHLKPGTFIAGRDEFNGTPSWSELRSVKIRYEKIHVHIGGIQEVQMDSFIRIRYPVDEDKYSFLGKDKAGRYYLIKGTLETGIPFNTNLTLEDRKIMPGIKENTFIAFDGTVFLVVDYFLPAINLPIADGQNEIAGAFKYNNGVIVGLWNIGQEKMHFKYISANNSIQDILSDTQADIHSCVGFQISKRSFLFQPDADKDLWLQVAPVGGQFKTENFPYKSVIQLAQDKMLATDGNGVWAYYELSFSSVEPEETSVKLHVV